MFRHAGVNCKVTDNLARAHWEKLVWNIPFNGLGVASAAGYEVLANQPTPILDARNIGPCLTTGQLLDGNRWESIVRELMGETIVAANALGHALEPALADRMIALTRKTKSYKSSTVLDFEAGRPLELESLFLEPLRQAHSAKVATPRLNRLCRVLKHLDAVRATGPRE
jgi:2-dehydropantoate 2-reductase